MFAAHEDRSAPFPELRRSGMSAETCLEHGAPTGFTKRAVVHLILLESLFRMDMFIHFHGTHVFRIARRCRCWKILPHQHEICQGLWSRN